MIEIIIPAKKSINPLILSKIHLNTSTSTSSLITVGGIPSNTNPSAISSKSTSSVSKFPPSGFSGSVGTSSIGEKCTPSSDISLAACVKTYLVLPIVLILTGFPTQSVYSLFPKYNATCVCAIRISPWLN